MHGLPILAPWLLSDQTVGVIGRTSRSGTRKEPGFRPDSGNGMYKKTMLREHDAGVGQDPIKVFPQQDHQIGAGRARAPNGRWISIRRG